MRFIILAVLLATGALIPQEVVAGQTKPSRIACLSAASYDEALRAVAANDKDWFRQLQAAKLCMIVKAGAKAQRIDCSWTGCQYRVWYGSRSVILWMSINSIQE